VRIDCQRLVEQWQGFGGSILLDVKNAEQMQCLEMLRLRGEHRAIDLLRRRQVALTMEVNPALDRLVWRHHGRGSREAALGGRKHCRIHHVTPRELCDRVRVGGRKTDDYRRARN
jgi:hypothetical protein